MVMCIELGLVVYFLCTFLVAVDILYEDNVRCLPL